MWGCSAECYLIFQQIRWLQYLETFTFLTGWNACFFKYSFKLGFRYVLNQCIQTHFVRMSLAGEVQGAERCSCEWIHAIQFHFEAVSLLSQTQ